MHKWLFYSTLLAIISTSLNLFLLCKIDTTWLFSSQNTCNLVQVKNFATPPLHLACPAIIGSLVGEVVKNTKTPRFRFSDCEKAKIDKRQMTGDAASCANLWMGAQTTLLSR